ncbi:MAG TPA: glycosyl transferase [Legionella sp.]|nr:glycosyl transferase [Legionella sp.]
MYQCIWKVVADMFNPRVSIVIPTYNHAQFLRKALDSIVAQTMPDWEAIVVNNFSEDDTISLVESYADSRIRLINFANHGVIAAARNHGLIHSRAQIVAFLDSDDFWYPQKLELCMEKLADDYDLVCHAEIWAGPGKQRRTVLYGPETRATYESLLLEGNCLSTSAVVVRKECLDQVGMFSVEKEFVTAEDYELWLRIAASGARIGFVPAVLGEYLIHQSNQSRAGLRNMHAAMAVFLAHAEKGQNLFPLPKLKRREAIIYYSGGRSLQDSGLYTEAWTYFWKAVRTYPCAPKFYVAMILNALKQRP